MRLKIKQNNNTYSYKNTKDEYVVLCTERESTMEHALVNFKFSFYFVKNMLKN